MLDRREAVQKLVLNAARLSGVAPLAGRFVGGIGAILMLHRVTHAAGGATGLNGHLSITPAFLHRLLQRMKQAGYRFVSMDEAVELLRAGGGGTPFAAITADDGYRDNVAEALPVLEAHDAPITIFVAPGLVDGTADLWWEVAERIVEHSDAVRMPGGATVASATREQRIEAFRRIEAHLTRDVDETAVIPALRAIAAVNGIDWSEPSREGLMDWKELAAAARHPLVTIGAHTVHHVSLKRLQEHEARLEMTACADRIEAELGRRPHHLAYPYGHERAVGCREVRLAAECGFASAVTTRHGVVVRGHAAHLHALPRISVNGRFQQVGHVTTMLSGITTPLANRGRRLVTV